ncbi:hypothetical protein GYMLUDRAFT_907528 [Collybiopsis luxurians FD-317 M1]|nr:hypothetical protein GYMLUDRAFT_907528 [Collybiopsis luxurians FD-317 M1]
MYVYYRNLMIRSTKVLPSLHLKSNQTGFFCPESDAALLEMISIFHFSRRDSSNSTQNDFALATILVSSIALSSFSTAYASFSVLNSLVVFRISRRRGCPF